MTTLEKIGISRDAVMRLTAPKPKPKPKHPRNLPADQVRRSYTKEQCEQVWTLRQTGMTCKHISEMTGIPKGTVFHICKRAGRNDKRDTK